jgi:predicted N-acetyltransferase YhbS
MITLRKEQKKDFDSIAMINDMAFGRKAESKLIDALRNTAEFIPDLSIVAEVNEKVIGHILFYPISIVDGKKKYTSLALAPMSVLPAFRKKSIGKLLVLYGIQTAKDLGHKSVIVLGHPSYYPKFGFERASKWKIKSAFPAPDEAFLAIELKKGCLDKISGTVVYPEAFDAL